MIILNKGEEHHVAYKVRVSTPGMFIVSGGSGFLAPTEERRIETHLRSHARNTTDLNSVKFSIDLIGVSAEDARVLDSKEYWRGLGRNTQGALRRSVFCEIIDNPRGLVESSNDKIWDDETYSVVSEYSIDSERGFSVQSYESDEDIGTSEQCDADDYAKTGKMFDKKTVRFSAEVEEQLLNSSTKDGGKGMLKRRGRRKSDNIDQNADFGSSEKEAYETVDEINQLSILQDNSLLELMIKNVSPDTPLTNEEIASLKVARNMLNLNQWEDWKKHAQQEKQKRNIREHLRDLSILVPESDSKVGSYDAYDEIVKEDYSFEPAYSHELRKIESPIHTYEPLKIVSRLESFSLNKPNFFLKCAANNKYDISENGLSQKEETAESIPLCEGTGDGNAEMIRSTSTRIASACSAAKVLFLSLESDQHASGTSPTTLAVLQEMIYSLEQSKSGLDKVLSIGQEGVKNVKISKSNSPTLSAASILSSPTYSSGTLNRIIKDEENINQAVVHTIHKIGYGDVVLGKSPIGVNSPNPNPNPSPSPSPYP